MDTITVGSIHRHVEIPVHDGGLAGDLDVPANAVGIVIFAHGSGSSRLSPRNQYVAKLLRQARLATLLLDLLTEEEEREDDLTTAYRFDIHLLTTRLTGAIRWVEGSDELRPMPIGLFGASTGAAAALAAAAIHGQHVSAVVSRGGRPDLAGGSLAHVRAATLLIVGGYDPTVLALNRDALARLGCEKQLAVVPRATHLFEEPGALEEVARLAQQWFVRHLAPT
jgi:pimeloyl-ACP methyl ester carboxylesterase